MTSPMTQRQWHQHSHNDVINSITRGASTVNDVTDGVNMANDVSSSFNAPKSIANDIINKTSTANDITPAATWPMTSSTAPK